MRSLPSCCAALGFLAANLMLSVASSAAPPRVLPEREHPRDRRLGELRTLNSEFPFQTVADIEQWPQRRGEIKRRILVSQGLWPMPPKGELNVVIHGRVERDDYVVDRVYFESIPGHYVTGSLYRPKNRSGPLPAILSPHGHWRNGRFYDAGADQIRNDLASGAERFEIGGRYPIQARAVQLARMGCLVFVYDMVGYADSIQIGHRPDRWEHLDGKEQWGFFSTQAELRLQNMMGLQTWNSIRALDFLLQLDQTDPQRIGVTGASGGGTQSMIIAAIDERVTAAMPCVMVSTAMQGGCTCENASYLRIDQGNVDIAAAIAPRPLGLTAADDWTVELETKGYPDLLALYSKLGHRDRLTAAFNTHFGHNYNHVNRTVMYNFFNRHFDLGLPTPVLERDFQPLSVEEATVWTAEHPAPRGEHVGDSHEVQLLQRVTQVTSAQVEALVPDSAETLPQFRRVIGGAWKTILGRDFDDLGQVDFRQVDRRAKDGHKLTLGLLDHQGEQLPVIESTPDDGDWRGTVVVVADPGKRALFSGDQLASRWAELTRRGYRVISADLFGQGEFADEGQPLESQRMWHQRDGRAGWHRFSGYTYGYNPPLFVRRVHDVLTLLRYGSQSGGGTIRLVALGEQAGPVALAARMQAPQVIERSFVDCGGFRFGDLTRQDHPMFVPGAVKYLGVDGLLALGLPGRIDWVGEIGPAATAVEQALGGTDAVTVHATGEELLTAVSHQP